MLTNFYIEMELTKEQQKLIDDLLKVDNFNSEYKKKKQEVDTLLSSVRTSLNDLSYRERQLEAKANERLSQLQKTQSEIAILIKEKSTSFPWLANAISDYLNLQDNTVSNFLKTKKHPAQVTGESVRRIATEKKILTRQLLLTKYRVDYYEILFPFLTEFFDENIDELLIQVVQEHEQEESEDDPVKKYVTSGEYEKLSRTERNQKALDRYLASRKTPYQIGRDYERYIGYKYEQQGFEVSYHGIAEGLEDLGRDLICIQQGKIEVVQCKCWASHKMIHEKHINQLFGTTVKYYIDYVEGQYQNYNLSLFPDLLREGNIRPVFYTSTKLSDTAKRFAEALGMEIHENIPLQQYPIIKCHTSKQTGEKIYHLPFDQMYDRTILEKKYGEFYAMTVKEAESKGFRRAWRWHGNS